MNNQQIKNRVYQYRLSAKTLVAERVNVNESKKMYDFLVSKVYDNSSICVYESAYAIFTDSTSPIKSITK